MGAVALAGRSHNAKIPAGTLITSFVDKDATIQIDSTAVPIEAKSSDKTASADSHSTELVSDNVDSKKDVKGATSKIDD